MSFYFPNVDYTYIFKREGTDEDPFIFLIDENHVRNKALMLREVPSKNKGIKIEDSKGNELEETESDEPASNQYRVDYSVGIVHFNSSKNGERMTCEYTGMGSVFISASRVMMQGGEDDPLESLEDLLAYAQEGVNTLEQVGHLDFIGEYSDTHEYRKWNFVTYNNKTFVATRNSNGVSPDDSSYWRLVSSGVGFSGVYSEDKAYAVGDLVSDKDRKNLYVSKKMNNNSSLNDSDSWEKIVTLEDTIDDMSNTIDEKINELNDVVEELISNDKDRDDNEEERDSSMVDALAQLELFKEDLEGQEDTRKENESSRKSSESSRESGEDVRNTNEAERKINEEKRESQEEDRKQNFDSSVGEIEEKIGEFDSLSSEVKNTLTEFEILENDVEVALENANLTIDKIDGFTHRGEYDSEEEYKRFNLVKHEGSTYMAMQDIEPAEVTDEGDEMDFEDENYWRLIAKRGRDIGDLSIEGVSPDEEGNISLESLGLAEENFVIETRDEIVEDYENLFGDLSDLRTSRKENIVDAINELKGRIDELIDLIN